MQIKASRQVWWIGAVTLAGGLCALSACSKTGAETEEIGQLSIQSLEDRVNKIQEKIEKAKEESSICSTIDGSTDCLMSENKCLWYRDIFSGTTGSWGACMLRCSDMKDKQVCKIDELWYCDWKDKRCDRNRFIDRCGVANKYNSSFDRNKECEKVIEKGYNCIWDSSISKNECRRKL